MSLSFRRNRAGSAAVLHRVGDGILASTAGDAAALRAAAADKEDGGIAGC